MQAGVDAVEGVLEARARLAVDLAHRRLERLQCVGEILALPVQVLLALGLLLEFADRREIHLAQALDLALGLLQLRFPGLDRRLRCERGEQFREFEVRRRQLFGDAFAAHAHLLRREPRLIQAGAGGFEPLIDRGALVRRARAAAHRAPRSRSCRVQLRLDLRARRKRLLELALAARRAAPRRRQAARASSSRRVASSSQLLLDARRGRRSEACDERRDSTCSASSRARCCADCAAARAAASSVRSRSRSCFEFDALRLERRQRVDRRFHAARARRADPSRCAASSPRTSASSVSSCAMRRAASVRARLGRFELRAPIDVLAMQPVDLALQPLAPILVFAHALAASRSSSPFERP